MHKVAGTASIRALFIGMLKPGVVNSEAQSPDTGRKRGLRTGWWLLALVALQRKGPSKGMSRLGLGSVDSRLHTSGHET